MRKNYSAAPLIYVTEVEFSCVTESDGSRGLFVRRDRPGLDCKRLHEVSRSHRAGVSHEPVCEFAARLPLQLALIGCSAGP